VRLLVLCSSTGSAGPHSLFERARDFGLRWLNVHSSFANLELAGLTQSVARAFKRLELDKSDRKTNRTELYLFLTPRILKTDADADSVTAPRLPKVEQR